MIDAAVRDVMQSDPVTVPPEMELRDLVELFVNERLAAAPVVDGNGKLCGMVSERDIVLQEVEGDVHFPYFVPILDGLVFVEPFGAYEEQMQKAFAATVGDLMSREVRTVGPDDDHPRGGQEDGEARHLAARGRRGRQARRRDQPGRRRARPRALRVPRHPSDGALAGRHRRSARSAPTFGDCARRSARARSSRWSRRTATGTARPTSAGWRWTRAPRRSCVATLGEARALRDALPAARIIVHGAARAGRGARGGRAGGRLLGPRTCRARVRDRTDLGVHVKADTGMGRWGLDPDAALAVGRTLADARSTPGPRLCGLMSHLATADETDTAFARRAGARVRPGGRGLPAVRAAPRQLRGHPAAAGGPLRRRALRHRAVRHLALATTTRPTTASRRRCAGRARWRRCGGSRPATRRATAGA